MYEGLARVIMFVTWRYVALRTFTLHHDAPFGSFSRPAEPEKRTALWQGKKSSGAAEKFPRRSDEGQRGEIGGGKDRERIEREGGEREG